MDGLQNEPLTDAELDALFGRLFPHGFAGADVLAEVASDGWEQSPLLACFHPHVGKKSQPVEMNGRRACRAATRALDSIYRVAAVSTTAGARVVRGTRRAARAGGLALRFATIAVDQCCSGARRETDVGPLLQGVTRLECRPDESSASRWSGQSPPRVTDRTWWTMISDGTPPVRR
jgi:hypothetical protein